MTCHGVDNVGGLLDCHADGWHGLCGADESVCQVGGIFVCIGRGRRVFVGLLKRTDADEDDLMCHGVGGLVASSIGRGRCGFVGLLARADAGDDDLMCHSVGGLGASSIGCGQHGFVGLLVRADADEDGRLRRVDAGCIGE